MPQNKYTDADLPRFERKAFTKTIAKPDDEPLESSGSLSALQSLTAGPNVDKLLTEAKGTLARSGNLLEGVNRAGEQPDDNYDARLATDNEAPSVMDSTGGRLWKNIKHYVKTRPEAIEKGAMAGVFADPAIAVPSMAVMGLRSAANLAGGGMDRVKEHPYMTAMDVAGLGLGTSAAKAGVRALEPVATAETANSVLGALKSLVKGRAPSHGETVSAMEREAASRGITKPTSILDDARNGGGEFGGDRTTGHFDPRNLVTGQEEGLGAVPRFRQEAAGSAALKGLKNGLDPRISGLPPETMLSPNDEAVLKYISGGGAPETNRAMDVFRAEGAKNPLLEVAKSKKIIPVVK